jgi:hypothetical protein
MTPIATVQALVDALETAKQHIDDLVALYAPDQCLPEHVQAASERVHAHGMLWASASVVAPAGEAIAAGRALLAQQSEQVVEATEPVAEIIIAGDDFDMGLIDPLNAKLPQGRTLLYAAPVAQVVEALTEDEVRKVVGPLTALGIGHSVVRACAEKWGLRLEGQQ